MLRRIISLAALTILTACGQDSTPRQAAPDTADSGTQKPNASMEQIEIAPGLKSKTTTKGSGRVAMVGDIAEVHYTGWLYDEAAEDGRGEKFDSSVDRGQPFQFMLGAGRVIKGWDQGVAGMLVGETRELTIAPEMGYGERGAGAVIPPNATLLFEVELLGLQGPADDEATE